MVGHLRVHRGLEFQQQVEIEPVWPPTHAPDEIIVPAAQVVTDVAVTDPFKGAPVDVADPRLVDKAAEQVFDHPGVRKEQLVAGVVFHGHEYSAEEDRGARRSVPGAPQRHRWWVSAAGAVFRDLPDGDARARALSS